MTDTIRVDGRFNGPPDSANGGYIAGRLAGFVAGSSVRVRLFAPPPLDTALEVRRIEGGAELYQAETLLARALATRLEIEIPGVPDLAAAERATRNFRGFEEHVFPRCFVCGPERHTGDGLRIFPGELDGDRLVACPWVPDASLASAEGRIADAFLWAALDCPGGFSFPQPTSGAMLLGEIEVRLDGAIRAGERCVVTAWAIDHEGRKHRTGTALHTASGACIGVSLATWIEINEASG